MSDSVAGGAAGPAASRRRWLLGAVAAAAAAAGAGAAWWQTRAGGAGELEDGFWAGRFERPDGGELAMAGFRGKPLLVNFWATWCAPCVEEMPLLDGFFRQNASNGLQIVGLAIDQPSAVRRFLTRTPVAYPIGLAGLGGTEMLRALGNTQGGLPFTLAIDAGGTVLGRKMGKLDSADLEAWRHELFHG